MSAQELSALPSATELIHYALFTAQVRVLPGRFQPVDPVPLSCGVPIASSSLTRDATAWLIDADERVWPAQWETLCTRPDGSPRWALIDTLATVRSHQPETWTIVFVTDAPGSSSANRLGRSQHLPSDPHSVVVRLAGDNSIGANIEPLQAYFGGHESPELLRSEWTTQGPLRSTWTVEGQYQKHPWIRLQFVLTTFGESGLARIDLSWHNSRRARHPGGLWDLGDRGSELFASAGWRLTLPGGGGDRIAYQLEPGGDWIDSESLFDLLQESSGGEQWDCVNHVDRTGKVPWQFSGYRLHEGKSTLAGRRATPTVRVSGPLCQLTVTIPHFWQQFPKALKVPANFIDIGLFPPGRPSPHELQGGERKTHTIWLKVDSPGINSQSADLSWVHDPPRLVPVLGSELSIPGWPRLTSLDAAPISRLDSLCDEVLNGPASVFARREQIDEYGWRNFGDFFADHETRYYQGPPPLISHFNNQYDVLGGLLLQGLRTEDRRWSELAGSLARHITDIDLYHTDQDRAVFNGGLFWLTDHYSSCGTATHRCFSKWNAKPGQPYGGGPGCEHNYSTGLLAYHWLTGDHSASEAVIQLAEWVLAMDDGRQTVLGIVDDGPTGTATATADENYHGPGRGAGNSINSLLDAWLLSGQRRYLVAANGLLQRCIHPQDEVAARSLLDFERRWSYTVFLMAVFKFLECKREIHEIDADFEYARQSLLSYAGWMIDHERPYFDREEQMEFPTETWGAQELRKANVFRWAACYADEPLRSRLQEKGNEFAERAWHDLCRFPSRTFIRPFTLAMIQGLWDAALRETPGGSVLKAAENRNWPPPSEFVPQKARVKQMLKSPRGLCTALLRSVHPRRWGPFLDALWRMT